MQDSAELSHYSGLDPSVKRRIDGEREARVMAAQALQMRTERFRESNERAAKLREKHFISGTNPMIGGYF